MDTISEELVDFVAEELAKVGGVSWYPGRQDGPIARVVSERYRDRARVAIEAMRRFEALKSVQGPRQEKSRDDEPPVIAPVTMLRRDIEVGATVIYRPPGDRRAYPCTVERIEGNVAYLVPIISMTTFVVSIVDSIKSATDERERSA